MKTHASHAAATYATQSFKSFEGALFSFFRKECPQLGGDRTRRVLVQEIHAMVWRFFPATGHLEAGQTVWPTVHKDAKGAYGKPIQDTELTTFVLDLVLPGDAADRAAGRKLRDIKIDAAARLCIQACEQDGCLTNAELAILLKIAPETAGRYIATWEATHRQVLPRRGTIHDMGPTLTHKRIIIDKLFIERKTVQQTARETHHSLPAIQRYIGTFRQVLLCRRKGMTTEEAAYATRKTPALIKQYEEIIDNYAGQSHILEQILHYQPHIESNPEAWANECQRGN